ncbi:hypothetical protein CHLNCDRAFT_55871, partial [Chlorella variabilis]
VMLRFCVLALGSLLIGAGVSLACAFVLKRFDRLDASGASASLDSASYEIAVVVMGAYLAYLVAEASPPAAWHQRQLRQPWLRQQPTQQSAMTPGPPLCTCMVAGMSGIVALFFSGICHSHYSYYSASQEAR